jgi:hypothetical protein
MKKWLGLGMGAVVLRFKFVISIMFGALLLFSVQSRAQVSFSNPGGLDANDLANAEAATNLELSLVEPLFGMGCSTNVSFVHTSQSPCPGNEACNIGGGFVDVDQCAAQSSSTAGCTAPNCLGPCTEKLAAHEAVESCYGSNICDADSSVQWSRNGLDLADCTAPNGSDFKTILDSGNPVPTPTVPAPTPTGGSTACNTATTPLDQCLCESSDPAWQKGCYATFGGGRSVTPTPTGTPPVVPPTPSVPPSPSACSAAVTALDQCLCESSNPAWQEGCYATFGGGRVVTPAPTPTPVATPRRSPAPTPTPVVTPRRSPAPTATFVVTPPAHPTPTPNVGCPGITPLQQCLCESSNPAWQQGCKMAFL